MKLVDPKFRAALAVSIFLTAACSISQFPFLPFGRQTADPVLPLARCDDRVDVLCLVTFGIEPPDQMLVVLRASPGIPDDLETVIAYADDTFKYPCQPLDQVTSMITCAGPQLPLGSRFTVQVFATQENILLASGDFVLMALAVPTLQSGEAGLLTLSAPQTAPAAGTPLGPRPSSTPFGAGTVQATPTPIGGRISPTPPGGGTVQPTETPGAGTAYPNPHPPAAQ